MGKFSAYAVLRHMGKYMFEICQFKPSREQIYANSLGLSSDALYLDPVTNLFSGAWLLYLVWLPKVVTVGVQLTRSLRLEQLPPTRP